MKKFLLVIAAGCIFAGCHSKLDLDNVDPSAEVKMGLTLPVGSLRLTINDLVGNVDGLYIENGVLTWKYDTATARNYHQMNLADYISTTTDTLKIFDQIPAALAPYLDGSTATLFDIPLTFNFPVDLPLDGINAPEDQGNAERLDSAHITSANFYSVIKPLDLPIDWDWVDSIILDLGPRFKYPGPTGNRVAIYARNASSSYNFGDTIPLKLDAFTLDMMKKQLGPGSKAHEYYNNVYDTCSFAIRFRVTIPQGKTVNLKSTSAFQYELGAQFLDYTAIWGMFEASDEMSGHDLIDMSDTWKSFDFLTRAKVPFAEPSIDTKIITQIAGAFYLDRSVMFTLDENNDTTFAWFDANGKSWFDKLFGSDEYLTLDSKIGDSTTNMGVIFNHETNKGQIHRMFEKTPQKLGYTFKVFFNEGITPQIRITPNTAVRVKSTFTLPFIFHEGVWIDYPDTSEVSLSQISIDSIQANSSVIDTISATNVKLIMKAESTIPMSLKLTMHCVDENGNTVMDPLDKSKPFRLFNQDTIMINPPTVFTQTPGTNAWLPSPSNPGISTLMASLSKEQLNVFPQIKQIIYKAILDDNSIKYVSGMDNIRLTENSAVKLKIGLAGNIDAVLNFDKENK